MFAGAALASACGSQGGEVPTDPPATQEDVEDIDEGMVEAYGAPSPEDEPPPVEQTDEPPVPAYGAPLPEDLEPQ